jgi:hypothetical protein
MSCLSLPLFATSIAGGFSCLSKLLLLPMYDFKLQEDWGRFMNRKLSITVEVNDGMCHQFHSKQRAHGGSIYIPGNIERTLLEQAKCNGLNGS